MKRCLPNPTGTSRRRPAWAALLTAAALALLAGCTPAPTADAVPAPPATAETAESAQSAQSTANGNATAENGAPAPTLAAALDGCVEVCVISFLDLYQKVRRNFPEAQAVPAALRIRLGREMARIAKSHHMRLKACAEGDELAPYGVDCTGCMTMEVYEHALHARLTPPPGTVHPGRKECACYLGGDIGTYDSCGHLCRYCYANSSPEAVRRNRRLHDPASPFLIGGPLPGDEVRDARQESWLDGQLHF